LQQIRIFLNLLLCEPFILLSIITVVSPDLQICYVVTVANDAVIHIKLLSAVW